MDDMHWDTSGEAILRLLEAGENDHVEFKRSLPPENVIAKTLTAFANTRGGILLVGVSEPGKIVGLSDQEAKITLDRLTRVAKTLGLMECRTGISRINSAAIVYITVGLAPAHLRPIATAEGKAFAREGVKDVQVEVDLRNAFSGNLTLVSPAFHHSAKGIAIFVAMSFRTEEEPHLVDYRAAMERAAERTGNIDLKVMDLVEGDYEISQKIMDEIDSSDAVLADFTLNPRNVYFELGYARGKRKPVIQTARKDTNLEFDVRNWRTLFYRNATELEERLIAAFRAMKDQAKTATSKSAE